MSFGSPIGVPASTQFTMVDTCASVRLRSFLNCWMPTVRSMCHGGISRSDTLALMRRAYFLASSYVSSDIGAIEPGW